MFCPSCGLENAKANQFCRACGINLISVRNVLEKPDSITASAVSARDEIGRAVAQKIRETNSASKLNELLESALPEMEKFLESPEEKRLRRLREGSLIGFIGLGVAIGFSIAGYFNDSLFFFAALGAVTLFIGLAFILNGMFFTIPKKTLESKSQDAERQRQLDSNITDTNELVLPESNFEHASVIEETTRQLKEKEFLHRR